MAFDAGNIESRLTVDRTPFTQGLKASQAEARKFADGKYEAKLGVDTAGIKAELDKLKAQLDLATGDRTTTIHVRTDQRELDLLRNQMRQLQDQTGNATRRIAQGAKDDTKQFSLLRVAIEQLGPPLVPLAGGLLGLAASTAALGVTGVLTFKGIQAEIKKNTDLGKQYKVVLDSLKLSVGNSENVAARGFFSGFNQGADEALQKLPQFNLSLAQSSQTLGDIAHHAMAAVIGGFNTFNPLMQQGEQYLSKWVTESDHWANGPGGASFADKLSTDLEHAVPALEALGSLFSSLFAAINGPGLVALDGITAISRAIASIPTPILSGLLSTYLAFRTVSTITLLVEKATLALKGMAVAEAGAASAGLGGRGAGLLAGGLARVQPWLAGTLIAGIGGSYTYNQLGGGTAKQGYGVSSDTSMLKVGALAATSVLKNILNPSAWLDFAHGSIFRDALGIGHAKSGADQLQDVFGSYGRNNLLSQARTDQLGLNIATGKTPFPGQKFGPGSFVNLFGGTQSGAPDLNKLWYLKGGGAGGGLGKSQYAPGLASSYQADTAALKAYDQAVNQVAGSSAKLVSQQTVGLQANLRDASTIGQAQQAYSDYDKQLQSIQKSDSFWTDTKKKQTVEIDGNKYSVQAANAALAQANGDTTKATEILEGHRKAAAADQAALDESAREQVNLSKAYSQTTGNLKLTTDQVDLYRQALGISFDELSKGIVTADQFQAAIASIKDKLANGSSSIDDWVKAIQQFNKTGDTAISRGTLLSQALVAAQGPALEYANTMAQAATANQQMVDALRQVHKGVVDAKTGAIDFNNAGAGPLLQALSGLQENAMKAAAATYQYSLQTKNGKQAADDAYRVYVGQTRGALIDAAKHLGYNADTAKKLADQYFNIKNSGDLKKQIELIGQDKVQTALSGILKDLDILSGTHSGNVILDTSSALASLNQVGAALGAVFNRNFDINVHVQESKAISVGAGLSGALQSKQKTQESTQIHVSSSSTPGNAPFGGFTGVDYTGAGGGGGGGSKATKAPNPLIAQLGSAISSLVGYVSPVNALAAALGGVSAAIAAANKEGYKSTLATTVKNELNILKTDITARDKYRADLQVWKQKLAQDQQASATYGTGIRDTFLGQFTAQSGNGYAVGIKATLDQAVKDTQKFAALREKAQTLGLDPRLIQMYEQAGPQGAKNLEAIVSQGKAYVQSINADYSKLYGASAALGKEAAADKYRAAIAKDQAKIRSYTASVLTENKRITHELALIRAQVKQIEKDIVDGIRKK